MPADVAARTVRGEAVPLGVHLTYLFGVAAVAAIGAILSAAMTMQYAYGELPCPLCLLERLALFGVAFALIANLSGPYSSRWTGLALLFSLFLLIVSVRQTLLDIVPRPGHEYVGSAVFGLHMPVWSILIAVALIGAHALLLATVGGEGHMRGADPARIPWVRRAGAAAGLLILALAAVNAVSVVLQCGLGECHTMGYRLLGGLPGGV
jgi:disulfide bond formation protein DsbB